MRLQGAPDFVAAPHRGVSGLWTLQKVEGDTAWCLQGVPALVVASHLGRVSVGSGATWAKEVKAVNRKNRKSVVCFMMVKMFN